MSFELRIDIPEPFGVHDSGGEHAMMQQGDVYNINAVRLARDEEPIHEGRMFRMMYAGGVVTAHLPDAKGRSGAGDVAGYVVADKADSGVISVEDFYVKPEFRGQGLGGALLGNLITRVTQRSRIQGLEMANYGKELRIGGETYMLPGPYMQAYERWLGPEGFRRFQADMPKDWSGMRSLCPNESEPRHEIVVNGVPVMHIDQVRGGYAIPERPRKRYGHIVFAAIDLLNRRS